MFRIRIYGVVQGVGFRPFVKREADRLSIAGSVQNKGSYVEIMAHGSSGKIREFYHVVKSCPPERAVILRTELKEMPDAYSLHNTNLKTVHDKENTTSKGLHKFEIIESVHRDGEKFIPPDIGICDKCREELFTPGNRRYLHPFINCTQCGPRFTILNKLPYDRERTSMSGFEMCESCAAEYYSRESRRFDAQPVCCNDCGPELYLIGKDIRGSGAVKETRRIIAGGGIAAVKGIGGFHLCCDAGNEEAVKKLRARKSRPVKPFALMARDMDVIKRECVFGTAEEELLKSYQRPIVLMKKKEGGKAAPSVAPSNPKLGVMLPYAPVQLLLFSCDDGIEDFPDILVMTSGNVSGAPICTNDEEAVRELKGFADIFLSNNREILTRADDSVLEVFDGKPYMIRRSRGYAPLPLITAKELSSDEQAPVRIAVGGELKNSFCIGIDNNLYPSAYVGDLTDRRSGDALLNGIKRMEELLEVKPDVIVSDLHPGYNSVRIAEELSEKYGKPHIKIQHHYAHILSVMAENDHPGPVIGASFDGTGYGEDGTVWGGEIIKADRKGYERLSHIDSFKQPGGDIAAREGWRIAVSLIHDLYKGSETDIVKKLELCGEREAELLTKAMDSNTGTIMSTSCGRLFDAVSAALGICRISTFEGEAAMALQFAAERYEENPGAEKAGDIIKKTDIGGIMSTNELFGKLIEFKLKGESVEKLAFAFHLGLAEITAGEMIRQSGITGIKTMALSGGCFQNVLFLRLVKERLENAGLEVLIHSLIPPNDSGLAIGQGYSGLAVGQGYLTST